MTNPFVEALNNPTPGAIDLPLAGDRPAAGQNASQSPAGPQAATPIPYKNRDRVAGNALTGYSRAELESEEIDKGIGTTIRDGMDWGTAGTAAAVAMIPEIVSMPAAAVAGGLSAGMAALDGDEKTRAADAFRHTMESVAGVWHDTVTTSILEGIGTDDEKAHTAYEAIGEFFDSGLTFIGNGAVWLAKAHIKPVLEMSGGEWTPEIEARFFAYAKGAVAAAMWALPFKKVPMRIGHPGRAGPKGLDNRIGQKMYEEIYDPRNSPNNFPPKPEILRGPDPTYIQTSIASSKQTMARGPMTEAVQAAASEGVMSAAMETLWDAAASEHTAMGYDFSIQDFTLQTEPYHARINDLKLTLEAGFDAVTGEKLGKKAKKKLKKELADLEKQGPPARVRALLEYHPPERMLDDASDFMPTLSKGWYFKYVYEGFEGEVAPHQASRKRVGGETRTAPRVQTQESAGKVATLERQVSDITEQINRLDDVIEVRGEKGPTKTQTKRRKHLDNMRQDRRKDLAEETRRGDTEEMHLNSPEFLLAYKNYAARQFHINQRLKLADISMRDVEMSAADRSARQTEAVHELVNEDWKMAVEMENELHGDYDPTVGGKTRAGQHEVPGGAKAHPKVEAAELVGPERPHGKTAEQANEPYRAQADKRVMETQIAAEAAYKGSSIQLNEIGFLNGIEKAMQMMMEKALDKGLNKEMIVDWLKKHMRPANYGETFTQLREHMRQINLREAGRRAYVKQEAAQRDWTAEKVAEPIETTPNLELPAKGTYGKYGVKEDLPFNMLERFALLKEALSFEEVLMHPKLGPIRAQHKVSSLADQAVAKHGADVTKESQPGVIGASGRFYTPEEAGFLRYLIEDVVGIDYLLLPLEELQPTILRGGKGIDAPQLGVSMADIPFNTQAATVHKFGHVVRFINNDLSPTAPDLGLALRPGAGDLLHKVHTLTDAGFRRRVPDKDYPGDTGVLESRLARVAREWAGRKELSKAEYDRTRTPWGKRIDRYWDTKQSKESARRRAALTKDELNRRRISKDNQWYEARYEARTARETETLQRRDGHAEEKVAIMKGEHFTGGVDAQMMNWRNQTRNERFLELAKSRSPSWEQLQQVAADSGYPNKMAMLKDAHISLLHMIARELDIPIVQTALRREHPKTRDRLQREILAKDGTIPNQLTWAERQNIDVPQVSENRAGVDFAKMLKVSEAIEAKGTTPVRFDRWNQQFNERQAGRAEQSVPATVRQRMAYQPPRAEIDGWVKQAMVEAEWTAPQPSRRYVPEKVINEKLRSLGKGQDKATVKTRKALEKEREVTRRIDEWVATRTANEAKRADPKVVERVTDIDKAAQLSVNKPYQALRLNVKKGVKVVDETEFRGATFYKRPRYEVEASAAAVDELKVEMQFVKKANQALERQRNKEMTAYNKRRNAYLRDRMGKSPEGRQVADQMTPPPKRGPLGEARAIESAIMHGIPWEDVGGRTVKFKKTKGESGRTIVKEQRSELPEDIQAWAEQETSKAETAFERFKKNRGSLHANPIGLMADEAVHAMKGIFSWAAKRWKPEEGRKYGQPKQGLKDVQSSKKHSQFKEMAFGAQAQTPLITKLKDLISKHGIKHPAVVAYGNLLQNFDQLPHWVWSSSMEDISSYYNTKTNIRGLLVTGSQREGSLAHAIQTHGGTWMTGARDWIPQKFAGTNGGMTAAMNMEALRGMLGIGPQTPLVLALRRVMDNSYGMMQEALGDFKKTAPYVKDYFPLMLKKGLSLLDQDRLVDILMAEGKRAGRKMDLDTVGNQVRAMAGEDGWMRGKIGVRDKRTQAREHWNTEKTRTLMDLVPPEKLLEFIETDVAHVMTNYLRTASDRIAYGMKFGANDQKLTSMIKSVNKELNKLGESISAADSALINDLLAITQKEYSEVNQTWTNTQRHIIGLSNWAKLGLVVPGSMVEAIIPLRNRTLGKYWLPALAITAVSYPMRGAIRQIYRAKPGAKGLGSMGYDAIVGEVIGKVVNVTEMDMLTSTYAADIAPRAYNLAFIANGLHVMTNILQTASIKTFRMSMERFAVREAEIRAGRRKRTAAHEEDRLMFEYYGIKPQDAQGWVAGGAKMDGHFFLKQYAPALTKYMHENVMTARGVNQPRWHSNGNWAFLRHLKTYVTMFGNTVLPDMWNKATANVFAESPQHMALRAKNTGVVAGTYMAMMATAYASEQIMDWWKYGGKKRHPIYDKYGQSVFTDTMRSMNRMAIAGFPGMVIYDIWERSQYAGGGGGGPFEDLMTGAAGKDALRAGVMLASLMYAPLSDGEPPNRRQVAAFIANQLPMSSAMPRAKKSPAEEFVMTKPEMTKWIERQLKELGM